MGYFDTLFKMGIWPILLKMSRHLIDMLSS